MKEAPAHIVSMAASLAGMVEVITVQPFDMVKTRNQLNRFIPPSVWKSFAEVYSEGGILRFYRGLLPELGGFIPKTNAQYIAYEYSRRYFTKHYNNNECNWQICALSGWLAGYATALTVTPSQIVKVRLQSKEHLNLYKNTFNCYYKVLSNEGPRSLMIGLGPTIWRNSTWNFIYFGLMYHIKENMLPDVTHKPRIYSLSQTLFSGFIGGVIATLFNAPFDVVKSRFQQQTLNDPNKHRFTLLTLYKIYKYDGGFKGIYRGLQPKILRMGIGGAVSMATFELICASFVNYHNTYEKYPNETLTLN